MKQNNLLFTIAVILIVVIHYSAAQLQKAECANITSCSTCILRSYCVWCVTKAKCTKQDCGNDNVIYPKNIGSALMSGDSFCPKIVESAVRTVKSGTKMGFEVKITQIHLYMAFTTWKCRVVVDGNESVINAVLLGDTVFCESVLLENKSERPYMNGRISVLWDYSKSFDGAVPIRVCRCDLDPQCTACK